MTGFLLKDLSAKHFVIIGSSMVCMGLLLTSVVVRNLGELIMTYSVFIGIGLGLINPAAFIAIFSCFQNSRKQAIGVVLAALGLGQLIMPLIARSLLQHLSCQVTIICMAALSFIGLIGANLLAPIKWRSQCENDEEQRLLISKKQTNDFITVREIMRASDLDLLSDCSYLAIAIGLSFIFALSSDFTKMLPNFLMVSIFFMHKIIFTELSDCLSFISVQTKSRRQSDIHFNTCHQYIRYNYSCNLRFRDECIETFFENSFYYRHDWHVTVQADFITCERRF
jgi:MFS family permease